MNKRKNKSVVILITYFAVAHYIFSPLSHVGIELTFSNDIILGMACKNILMLSMTLGYRPDTTQFF